MEGEWGRAERWLWWDKGQGRSLWYVTSEQRPEGAWRKLSAGERLLQVEEQQVQRPWGQTRKRARTWHPRLDRSGTLSPHRPKTVITKERSCLHQQRAAVCPPLPSTALTPLPRMLCAVPWLLLTTKAQPGAPGLWDQGGKTTYPPTAPTALLSLNLLGQLPQGREVQSDRAGKEHRSRSRWARALPLHPDTRNSKQPRQSWKRRVQLEDSHFLTEDNAAETQCGAGLKAGIQTNRTERRAQKLTFA